MFPAVPRQHEVIKPGCLLMLSHKEFMQDASKSWKSQKPLKPNKRLIIHDTPDLQTAQTVQAPPQSPQKLEGHHSKQGTIGWVLQPNCYMRGWNNNIYLTSADGVKSRLSFPKVHRCRRKLYSPILPTVITAVSEMSGGCFSLWCKSEHSHYSTAQIVQRGHSKVWG